MEDAIKYLDNLAKKLNKYATTKELGTEMVKGLRLSDTDKGARTNARIEAAQKGKGFNESETPKEELKSVKNDIVEEMINRTIEDIFKG